MLNPSVTARVMDKFQPLILKAAMMAAFITLMGCNRQAPSTVTADPKTFESASAEIKADWDKALAAAATNDYATALLTCRKLQGLEALTPDQRAAVAKTMAAVEARLMDAAQKGDANATNALAEIRRHWR